MSLRQRKGSALLVVLGMVAFIVISAVAFAAYMRYSRAPSSFLRQNIASRMIVKAALAEAISSVDEAIGNNPHPNIGHASQSYQYEDVQHNITTAGTNNYWRGRVLVGQERDLPDYDDTVSTLTYEGLAYIPPALVNEARYYSRHTPTAQWRSLDFDVGRYAFCAIDVSDFFDVNIMSAALPRSSAANSRITLNYLFNSSSEAESWENLVDQYRDCDEDAGTISLSKKVPLISVADMNLAIGKSSYGGFQSPFCLYDHQTALNFYGDENKTENAAAMTFVTDGWYPKTVNASKKNVCDLAMEAGQPFTSAFLNQHPTYEEIGNFQSTCADRLKNFNLPFCGKAALFDYLDEDNVPVSLAIPTLERVPMVCGLTPANKNSTFRLTGGGDKNTDAYDYGGVPEDDATSRKVTREYKYSLLISPDLFSGVDVIAAYPFNHDDGVTDTFTMSGVGAVFFATEDVGLRLSNPDNSSFQFENVKDIATPELREEKGVGVMVLPLKCGGNLKSDAVNSGENIARAYQLDASGAEAFFVALAEKPFISAKISWQQTRTKQNGSFSPWEPEDPNVEEGKFEVESGATCSASPVNGRGSAAEFKIDEVLKNGGKTLRLYFAVWARVMCGSDTVDMVPAWVVNDKLNPDNHNVDDAPSQVAIQRDVSGEELPIIRFDTDFSLEPSLKNLSTMLSGGTEKDINVTYAETKGVMISDPRHNHAPESWFREDGVSANQWFTFAKQDAEARDGDLFLAVSDQGYMQSVYELANLPRFCNNGFGAKVDGGFAEDLGHMMSVRTFNKSTGFQSHGSELNHNFMWKTYCPFKKYLEDGDGFEDLEIANEGVGFKVNPYSDCTNIIMAAFANTPLDWACSATNEPFRGMDAGKFNKTYAWHDATYNPGDNQLSDLEGVGGIFIEEMHKNGGEDWEVAWENMWFDRITEVEQKLGNVVYNTDKKFLYGFWRDCFAVKQQLFLVFVRAEPCMMGGGSAGITPPQLGARAVALVWRDPNENPNGPNLPHKTRILFYRQFD